MKSWSKVLFVLFIMLAGMSLLATRLSAQNRATGEIRGTVFDPSGARVPGVTVHITNTLTGVHVAAASDSTGTYDAPFLQPGTYSLTFQKEGFKQFVRAGIILPIEVLTVDAQLQVGAVSQTVTVTGASPLVQSESSDRKTTMGSSEITELPFVSRVETSYLALAPGASFGVSIAAGSGAVSYRMGFNGQRVFDSIP